MERDISDRRVVSLLDEDGLSFRQVAALLGCRWGRCSGRRHRVRQARVSAELTEVPADPVLSLLTAGDVEHLGVSATDVVGGLTPLDRYRVLGLPAGTAGDAARAVRPWPGR